MQNLEIFCCHNDDVVISVVEKMKTSSLQKCFVFENQPIMSSVIRVIVVVFLFGFYDPSRLFHSF